MRLLGGDSVVADGFADRGRFRLQPAIVAVEESERTLGLEAVGAVEKILRRSGRRRHCGRGDRQSENEEVVA